MGILFQGEGKMKKKKKKNKAEELEKKKHLPHKIRGKQKHLPLKSMSPSSSVCHMSQMRTQ